MGNIYIFQDVAYWLGYKLVKPCFFLGYMQDITEVVIHTTQGPSIYVIQSYRESVYSRYCIFVNTVRRDTKWGYDTKTMTSVRDAKNQGWIPECFVIHKWYIHYTQ